MNLKLDSAILYTKDIKRIRDFYEKIIGLEFHYQDEERFVSFHFANGVNLGIRLEKVDTRELAGYQTIFLKPEDIKSEFERLKKLDVVFEKEIQEFDWGIYFAVYDPDGNKVSFVESKK
jgi:predicted enzyme related to lactoylglutathione lyase